LYEISRASCGLVAAIGLLVLVGWSLDYHPLTSLTPRLAAMKPNTALSFVALGVALWLLGDASAQRSVPHVRVARGLAAFVMLVGALTLTEYVFVFDAGIDQLLFIDRTKQTLPGRMSPVTAAHLVLLGAALLSYDHADPSRWHVAQWLALTTAFSSLVALLGYLYDVRALYAVGPFSSIALHTAASFLLLSVSILCFRPREGLMRVVVGDGPVGVLVRRLIPAAVVVPIVLGFVTLKGEQAGLYGSAFGAALFATSSLFCFVFPIVWTGRGLWNLDRERREALAGLIQSEARNRAVLEAALDAIVTVDETGTVVEFNPAAERTFGHARADAIGKKLPELLIPEPLREGHQRSFQRHLQSGESRILGKRVEIEALRADGTVFPIELTVVRIRSHGPPTFTAYIRDLTERHLAQEAEARAAAAVNKESTQRQRAEQALKQTEEQLRQSQKMDAIGRLAGGVAHDFNNLLSVILSYGAMLVQELPPGNQMRADVEEMIRASERAAKLTRQLLAFGRQQVLAPRVVDLNETIGTLSQMLRRLINEDVELSFQLGARGKAYVDPGQLEQVVMNLVINARDAMPHGGKLTLETVDMELDASYAGGHLDVAPGPYVMLSVSDTGVGMDETTQARMFEPFFTTKEQGKGTGLGLSTVFGIVKQSGGSIWVYSEVGEGTTIKVYLPRANREMPAAQPAFMQATSLRGSETVLLVEDNQQVRALAGTILRKNGYDVLEAASGDDALALSERFGGTIHALLTDVVMPRMSGRTLAERLAERRGNMKVIFMSGYTDDAIVQHGVLDAGIFFIQKPLMPEPLLAKLREVLDGAA
jgi:PAS domain S-box-containing protein